MIAYEIQLRYVVRDKIQSQDKKIFVRKKFYRKINFSEKISWILSQTEFCLALNFVSDFQCTFLSCLGQINA